MWAWFLPTVAAVHVTMFLDPYCTSFIQLADNSLTGTGSCESFTFAGENIFKIKMQCSALTADGTSTEFQICDKNTCSSSLFAICFDDRPHLPPPGTCIRMHTRPNIPALSTVTNAFYFTYSCGSTKAAPDTTCLSDLQVPDSINPSSVIDSILGFVCFAPSVRNVAANVAGKLGTIVSNSFNIDFTNANGAMTVSGLTSPMNFTLSYDPALLASAGAGVLGCEWNNGGDWLDTGCVLISQDTVNHKAICSCNHATEFALVVRKYDLAILPTSAPPTASPPTPRPSTGVPTAPTAPTAPTSPTAAPTAFPSSAPTAVALGAALQGADVTSYSSQFYGVDTSFAVIFALIMAASIVQSVRLVIGRKIEEVLKSPILWQHVAMAVISLLRVIELSARAGEDGSDVNLALILSTIPYLVSFAIFTFCVTSWAKMTFFAVDKQGKRRLDIALCVVLFVLFALLVGFPIGVAQSPTLETQAEVSIAATWTMAMVMMTLCLLILGFGLYLAKTVKSSYGASSSNSSNTATKSKGEALANKIAIVAIIFSICFMGESLCLICSISQPFVLDLGELATLTGVFYMFHAASLVTLLVMLWKAVDATSAPRESKMSTAESMTTSRSHASVAHPV